MSNMDTTQQIDEFIAENGGDTRDALNVALARLGRYETEIDRLRTQATFLRNQYLSLLERMADNGY